MQRFFSKISLSKFFVDEFKKRKLGSSVAFPPEVVDIRQWQWNGFIADVRYTLYLNLKKYSRDLLDTSERNKINKAERNNLKCFAATENNFPEVIRCLNDTGNRKNFRCNLTEEDLLTLSKLLGRNVSVFMFVF